MKYLYGGKVYEAKGRFLSRLERQGKSKEVILFHENN